MTHHDQHQHQRSQQHPHTVEPEKSQPAAVPTTDAELQPKSHLRPDPERDAVPSDAGVVTKKPHFYGDDADPNEPVRPELGAPEEKDEIPAVPQYKDGTDPANQPQRPAREE